MKIRLATPEDAESVAAIYAPIVLETTIWFEWDTEEQTIGFLRKADAGPPVKDLCRKHGFSEPCH